MIALLRLRAGPHTGLDHGSVQSSPYRESKLSLVFDQSQKMKCLPRGAFTKQLQITILRYL
jgi:hypothetical protein